MQVRTAAARFAKFVSGLEYDSLPSEVVEAAKLHALDTIGVGIAAAVLPNEASTARASVSLFSGQGGRSDASLIGSGAKVPSSHAAFANASLMHALDYDDIHTDSRVHTSTSIVPASLACAERSGAGGRDLIVAMVAGQEIASRVGMGGPVHFQKHGFHSTPVAGVFGATASAAAILRLDAEQTAHAFGIAGDVAGGTNAWIAEGTQNKHLHAGWAAHNGIVSADLAAHGAEGPPGVFEGRYGLYEALTGEADADMSKVLDTLGVVWETPGIAFKAYPSCYWMHGSLGAAHEIRGRIVGRLAEIESIEAIVPTPAVTIVLEPRETRVRPLTPYAGKFSLQYSVAAMLLRGKVDLDTYTLDAMHDDEVLDLAARVTYRVSERMDSWRQLYPGGLEVRLRDGTELRAEIPEPLGAPLNPISKADLLAKFSRCAGYGLEAEKVETLADALLHLEEPGAVGTVGILLRQVSNPID